MCKSFVLDTFSLTMLMWSPHSGPGMFTDANVVFYLLLARLSEDTLVIKADYKAIELQNKTQKYK